MRTVIEAAVDNLPETYRSVFMLREVEGLTTAETAESLDISEEVVKVRLHRARAMMRRHDTNAHGSGHGDSISISGRTLRSGGCIRIGKASFI